MQGLSPHEVSNFFFAVAVLLIAARAAAEVAQWLRQPGVVGEILAGVVLGPTVFGTLAPELQARVFPSEGSVAIALNSLGTLAIALFLLVAGMEIDLSAVWRQGKAALRVGLIGIIVPFALGFVPASLTPDWFGAADESKPMLFGLFFATAMAITALPVIAKILFDLKIFHTDVGVTIISAAILNDLAGWIIFAFVLSLMGVASHTFTPAVTATLTIFFTIFMLTVGRWAVNRALPWIQAHTQWPAGILAFALSMTLLMGALTEWVGVHAIFGAFLFGIALGDSTHLRRRTRTTIDQFVSFIFAPIFFASIGLQANFVESFNLPLVLVVLLIASMGKVLGCSAAARGAGFGSRESLAVGFGMNARGAMEIVLGLLALQAGIIGEELFVALVIMALLTSMTSGTLIQYVIGHKRQVSFIKFVSSKTFMPILEPGDRFEVTRLLTVAAAEAAGVSADPAVASVLTRERLFNSSMGNGIAIPHARLPGLKQPVVAVGLSRDGINWESRDNLPVHVVIVVLAPDDNPSLHLSVLGSVARAFRRPQAAPSLASTASNLTELRAFLRVESTPHAGEPDHASLP
ncbi:MAG: cation:proton antiporter [Phycisphaerales bacterium]|nr:cation:proton antiporter [Phycisphaerales bacterium]